VRRVDQFFNTIRSIPIGGSPLVKVGTSDGAEQLAAFTTAANGRSFDQNFTGKFDVFGIARINVLHYVASLNQRVSSVTVTSEFKSEPSTTYEVDPNDTSLVALVLPNQALKSGVPPLDGSPDAGFRANVAAVVLGTPFSEHDNGIKVNDPFIVEAYAIDPFGNVNFREGSAATPT